MGEFGSGEREAKLRRWLRLVYGGRESPRPALAERAFDAWDDAARSEPYVACAVGDERAVRAMLDRDPGWANRAGGPLGMPPLVAVAFSGLMRLPRFAAGLRRCARTLLDAGADVNARWCSADFPDLALGAMYGAAGSNRDPELTRMLLDAGADVDDGESLYHSIGRGATACTRLLLEEGATVTGTGALFRMLDFDDVAGLAMMLEHGGDANEMSHHLDRPLHHAIRRGRSLAHVEALLAAGADPTACTSSGVSAAVLASRFGRTDVVRGLGVGALSADERFIAACACADRDEAEALLSTHPDMLHALSEEQQRQLPVLAEAGRGDAVETMVALGWPIDVRGGDWNASALNFAVFRGDAALTRFLLHHGASWTLEHGYNDNVVGTLSFASVEEPVAGGDWLGCAQALIASGAPPPGPQYEFADDVADYFAAMRRATT